MGGDTDQPGGRSKGYTKLAGVVCLTSIVVVLVFFGWMVWDFRWMSDDGFINVRIVENILAGYGPVFNPGERVEAYTSPLWVGLLSAAGLFGANVPWASVVAGLVGSVCGLGAASIASLMLRDGSTDWMGAAARQWAVPAGAVTYAVVPVTWDYGTSGLENGLSMAWLGGTYLAVAWFTASNRTLADGDWKIYGLACAVGLGPLVRPELALFSAAFAAPLVHEGWREITEERLTGREVAQYIVAAAALPVLYQIWRMGFFASLVPNTAVAKSAFGSRWQQGWYYVENFFGFYLLAFPLVLLGLRLVGTVSELVERAQTTRAIALVAPVVAALAHAVYIVKIGGGFMHGRLFLPAFFGLLLPVMVVGVRGESTVQTRVWACALFALGVWAAFCGLSFRIPEDNIHSIGDERNWYVNEAGVSNPVTVEDYEEMYFTGDAEKPRDAIEKQCPSAFSGSRDDAGECDRVVFVDRDAGFPLRPEHQFYSLRERWQSRGIVGAALRTAIGLKSLVMGPRIHVVDRAGLASPVAARLTVETRERPGHEKDMANAWFVGRFAADGDEAWPVRAKAAREALECGPLAELDRAVTAPLTVRRFAQNVVGSFRFHSLSIPRNPYDARRKFCGGLRLVKRLEGGVGGEQKQWVCPRGYGLAGFEGGSSEKKKALAQLRPICRPLPNGEVSKGAKTVRGPKIGGGAENTETITCPDGKFVTAIEGAAETFTHHIRLRCGAPTGEAQPGRAGPSLGEGTTDFTVRCSDGERVAGFVGRAGALIDAVGLVCRRSN